MKGLWFGTLVLVSLVIANSCSDDDSFADWTGQLQNRVITANETNNPTALGNQPLNNLLSTGSHDAAIWTVKSKSFLASGFPDNLFKTQSLDMAQQLCAGTRWFDLRFSYTGGEYKSFHGDLLVGYGESFTFVANQLVEFFNDTRYSKEIVFLRIKTSGGDKDEFSKLFPATFGSLLYQNTAPGGDPFLLTSTTLNEIWGKQPQGTIIIFNYEWKPSTNDPWLWEYALVHEGRYADAANIDNMIVRCNVGQQIRLTGYYDQYLNVTNVTRPFFGLWWTITGGNVESNTKDAWDKYESPFETFFVRNQGLIGNFIISDFVGQYDFMSYVFNYNKNLFATFPPISPFEGSTVVDASLPGEDLVPTNNTGECVESSDASGEFKAYAIALLVGIVFLGLVVICCVCAACCLLCKRKKKQHDYASV